MAGFDLGGGGGGNDNQEQIPQENLFLSSAATRGSFELWQHQQQIQRHHHQFYSSAPTMLGFSTDDQPHHHQLSAAGPSSSGGSRRGRASAGAISCQDCGNQAKKDCVHMRCRTCCKSRGFNCPTHLRSTWVPASKRRERQQQLAAAPHSRAGGGGEPSKRPRELATQLPTALAAAATTSGAMEAANFPPEVSSEAVFRCVRVSQLDEGDDEYAYQTAVNIGGHLFRGILYDHGPEAQYDQQQLHGEASSGGAEGINITAASQAALNAGTAAGGSGSGSGSVSAGLIDPSVYPTPLSAFMAGTQFFPHHPRP